MPRMGWWLWVVEVILQTQNRGKVRVLVFCRKIKHRAYAPWGVGV